MRRDSRPVIVVAGRPGQAQHLRGDPSAESKHRAVLAMTTALHEAGVPADQLAVALARSRFLPVDGELTDVELAEAIVAAHPAETNRLGRWFLDAPLHDGGRTWVLSKMWGRSTEPALEKLVDLAPTPGFAFEPGLVQQ